MNLEPVAQNLVFGLFVGGLYGIAAVGLSLVFGVQKVLNVAHGSLIMLGGYVSFWIFTWYGIDPFLAIVVTAALLFGLGLLLYLGLFFIVLVMFAPGGIAMILVQNLRVWKFGLLGRLMPRYGWVLAAALVALAGFVGIVEMTYHVTVAGAAPELKLAGIAVAPFTAAPWVVCMALAAAGAGLYLVAWRRARAEWDEVQREIEAKIVTLGLA